MRKLFFYLISAGFFFTIPSVCIFGQVGINSDNSIPDPSAGLDVKFDNKGILFPRLSRSQILAISNPANGLVVFCTTDDTFYGYVANIAAWKEITYGTGIISQPFSACGTPLTISHVAGTVAPVSKVVSYSTATNIPGESSKCWITSNLGADHQANSVNDDTETAAGWYWQFNRKQGYKHDGTRTPNSPWVTSIDENSDWQVVNDPCSIELGTGWRIPTLTEWTNVDAAGAWTDWIGPWNSGLKMHAAGYLNYSSGSVFDRGINGYAWSGQQFNSTTGWNLHFFSSNSSMFNYNKAFGFSIRCIQ